MAVPRFLAAVLLSTAGIVSAQIVDAIDWPAYLSRHDPVWRWNISGCTQGYAEWPQTIRRDATDCAATNCTSVERCIDEAASMCDRCTSCQAFALSPAWHGALLPQLYTGEDAGGMVPNPQWTTWAKGGSVLTNHSSCTGVGGGPTRWEDGAFYGNGLTGGVVLLDAEDPGHSIRFQIGRTDVADHRRNGTAGFTGSQMYDEPRLPIGSLGLITAGNITSGYIRQRLWNGTIEGNFNTSVGSISFLLYAHYTKLGFLLQWNATGGETPDPNTGAGGALLQFVPLPGNSTRQGAAPPAYQYNPPYTCTGSMWGQSTLVCTQPLLAGGNYATAVATRQWALGSAATDGAASFITVWHIANDWPAESSPVTAQTTVELLLATCQQSTYWALLDLHSSWWASYWPASFLSLPDTVVEAMYTLQMYKYASAARMDPGDGFSAGAGPAIDLMGPWWQESGWELYWWDMNVPVTYWATYAARRFNISATLTYWLHAGMAQLHANPSWPGRTNNSSDAAPWGSTYSATAGFSGISSYDLSSPWSIQPAVQMGNPTWIAHNLYLHARYTGNTSMLADIVYPLLRGTVNGYLTFAVNGSDGRIHLPPSSSPEYPYPSPNTPGNDTNYDMMLFTWGAQTLISLAGELGIADPLVPAWKDVLSRLAPFPTNEYGYMVDASHGFDVGHRHFSHAFALYPLHLLTWEDADGGSAESRDLFARTIDRWTGLTCVGGPQHNLCPNGFTFDGAASMSALMGSPWFNATSGGNGSSGSSTALSTAGSSRADAAYGNLTGFIYSGLMHASTSYSEAGGRPCFESPPGMANALQEMLLQSWGGRVRVFPALPAVWQDAVIHRLGAEGGLAVSAVQAGGVLQWVGVEAIDYTASGGPARTVVLASTLGPAAGLTTYPAGVAVQDTPHGDLTFSVPVGQTVVLYRTGSGLSPPFAVQALPGNSSQYNYWGKH